MATLSFTILTAKPTAENKFPVLLRISAKKQKAYIKTEYQLNDVSEWYNGKVVARTDAAMMNKRLSFELKNTQKGYPTLRITTVIQHLN